MVVMILVDGRISALSGSIVPTTMCVEASNGDSFSGCVTTHVGGQGGTSAMVNINESLAIGLRPRDPALRALGDAKTPEKIGRASIRGWKKSGQYMPQYGIIYYRDWSIDGRYVNYEERDKCSHQVKGSNSRIGPEVGKAPEGNTAVSMKPNNGSTG